MRRTSSSTRSRPALYSWGSFAETRRGCPTGMSGPVASWLYASREETLTVSEPCSDCPFIVYGKPGCPACKVAVTRLEAAGVAHEYRDVSADPDAEARVRELGYQGVPVFEHAGQHFPFGDKFRDTLAAIRVSQVVAPDAA